MTRKDPEEIFAASAALAALDPALALVYATTPPVLWRHHPKGFAGLLKIMVGQQISIASADAIWGRFEQELGDVTAQTVMRTDDAAFRRVGFSAAKVAHARSLAQVVLEGGVDFDGLAGLDDSSALTKLMSLKGVGRWTAEIYLMFCEGRVDLFPAADIALKEGLRLADASPARLSIEALDQRALSWRPHRGVAAHMLWAYYSGVKRREIAPPTAPAAVSPPRVLEPSQKSFKTRPGGESG